MRLVTTILESSILELQWTDLPDLQIANTEIASSLGKMGMEISLFR